MAFVNFRASHPYSRVAGENVTLDEVEFGFSADLAFPDVFEGGKCLPCLGEACFDL